MSNIANLTLSGTAYFYSCKYVLLLFWEVAEWPSDDWIFVDFAFNIC